MRLIAYLCLAAALPLVTVAEAQPAAVSPAEPDARCLLVMAAVSNSSDQTSARAGQVGVIYFAGRVGARDPNFDFARLKTIAATMKPEAVQAELKQRCAPMLNNAMQSLQAALAPPASQTPPAKPATPPQRH